MATEDQVLDLMKQYAKLNIAMDARILSASYDPDNDRWVGIGVSSLAGGQLRLIARQRDKEWEIWRHRGSI